MKSLRRAVLAAVVLAAIACRPTAYKLIFYRADGDTLRRAGPEFNLVGFTRPTIERRPLPTIVTRHRSTSEGSFFAVSEDDIQLVPDDGPWKPITPKSPTLGGRSKEQ